MGSPERDRYAATPMPRFVLVADDSAVALLTVTRALASRELAFVACDSASAACSTDPSDAWCALLDFELGDGDGATVGEHLRRARPDLPLAFFTSAPDAPDVDRARALGPVFAKPAELHLAIAWVEEHARGRQPA